MNCDVCVTAVATIACIACDTTKGPFNIVRVLHPNRACESIVCKRCWALGKRGLK